MKAIFLNGPPRSGKDFITTTICDKHINFHPMKFADPLYKTVREAFALTEHQWAWMYKNAKDTPSKLLMGMSPREAMIWMSEDVMKPRFGEDYYGSLAVNRIRKAPDHEVIVWSDSGFHLEAKPVIDYIGPENCLLVHLHREECSFDGDSRSYWINDCIDRTMQVDNDFHVNDAIDSIMEWFV